MNRFIASAVIMFVILLVVSACSSSPGSDVSGNPGGTPGNANLPGDAGGADGPASIPTQDYSQYKIVTLLPKDGILAVDNPKFLSAEDADEEYAPDELVIGVEYDDDARAYSIPFLSRREIVNDTVGGVKIAVTW